MRVSTLSTCSRRVSATPHGIGQPSILCPETAIESMGFLNECGAQKKGKYEYGKHTYGKCSDRGGRLPERDLRRVVDERHHHREQRAVAMHLWD